MSLCEWKRSANTHGGSPLREMLVDSDGESDQSDEEPLADRPTGTDVEPIAVASNSSSGSDGARQYGSLSTTETDNSDNAATESSDAEHYD